MGFLAATAALTAVLLVAPFPQPPAYKSNYVLPTPAPPPTVALFIGDSYTAGALDTRADSTYAHQVCAVLKWICFYDAQGGTGFTATGKVNDPTFTPYIDRLDHDRTMWLPTVVIVTGGRNDTATAPDAEEAAVRKYLGAVRAAFPSARIVEVEPFWDDSTSPKPIATIRAQTLAAASEIGATWIPTEGWLKRSLIGSDGVHPTGPGHAHLAVQLVSALQQAGIGRS